jgi:cytochrome c-type biogenesis protein CcmE
LGGLRLLGDLRVDGGIFVVDGGTVAQPPPPTGGVAVKRYALFVVPALGLVAIILGFLLFNLSDALVYYRTPSEVLQQSQIDATDRMRLGGQVVPGSVAETSEGVDFQVTDGHASIAVVHTGAPQQLFQEGIGVVVEGSWDGERFRSDTMIIKHDEQYRTEDGAVYTPPHDDQVDEG